jgi:hypothetical protein
MKKFVLTTLSESGDEYIYFIEHPKMPTRKRLQKWLAVNGTDIEDDYCYERVNRIEEITTFQTL